MEIDNLKSDWKKIEFSEKNKIELEKMTFLKQHAVFKKFRLKLILETIGFGFLLLVYYDWFDGHLKPLYTNICLVFAILSILLHNTLGYLFLLKPIEKKNIQKNATEQLKKLKLYFTISILLSLLYGTSILLFFSSVISFNNDKKWTLVFGTIFFIQALFWSFRTWNTKIKRLKIQIEQFS